MQTNNTSNNVAPLHSNHSSTNANQTATANVNNNNERITNGIITANQGVDNNQSPLTNNSTNTTATTIQSNPPFNTTICPPFNTKHWESGGENVEVKTTWESVVEGWTVHDRASQNGVFRSNI